MLTTTHPTPPIEIIRQGGGRFEALIHAASKEDAEQERRKYLNAWPYMAYGTIAYEPRKNGHSWTVLVTRSLNCD